MKGALHRERTAASGRGVIAVGVIAVALLWPLQARAASPVVKATWATEINASSFRARGIVDTGSLTTTYRFDYISSAAYQGNLVSGRGGFTGALQMPIAGEAKLLGSATDQEVLQRVGGLGPETSYRYRLVAKNSDGESIGPARTITTQESTPPFTRAENRGWEMVSPVDKNGGGVAAPGELFGGGVFQAAAQGGSVTYGSASSFAGGAGAPGASQYVSVRTEDGWTTANVTLPTVAGAFGAEPDGAPYRIFSTGLSRALALRQPHTFALLGMNPAPDTLSTLASPDLRFAGATANLSRIVFATCEALTGDAVEVPGAEGCDPVFPNLYLKDEAGLRLLNLEPGNAIGTPGAALAARAGAISTDGSRVYWIDQAGALLVRDGNRSLLVDTEGEFQAAGADGAIAYYIKGSHLYRYSLGDESSSDLTPAGGVQGTLGISAAGAYVYYLDGDGVKLWHSGSTDPVASAADPSSFPPATGTARVSADGTDLAFLSSAALTDFDSEGVSELFRYDATSHSLLCVSCNPYGARPAGPSAIPGARANGSEVQIYKPRVMDSGGSRLFFDSADALVPEDTNGEQDVYEWWAQGVAGCGKASGCLGLISSGKAAEGSSFIDASADAGDVFFITDGSLVSFDPGAVDVYDARLGGGFPESESPAPCFGDACQPLPPEPDDPTPGTLFHGSEGNPPLRIQRPVKKHKGRKGHRRKHKYRGGDREHKHLGAHR